MQQGKGRRCIATFRTTLSLLKVLRTARYVPPYTKMLRVVKKLTLKMQMKMCAGEGGFGGGGIGIGHNYNTSFFKAATLDDSVFAVPKICLAPGTRYCAYP